MKKLNTSSWIFLSLMISTFPLLMSAQISGQCSNCPIDFFTAAVNGVVVDEIEMPAPAVDDLGAVPLVSVCFDITHDWLGDLFIVLESPAGKEYFLMGDDDNNSGGCGDPSYNVNVCFIPGSDNPLTNGEGYMFYCGSDPSACLSGEWNVACGPAMISDLTPDAVAAPNCDLNDFNESGDPVGGIWRVRLGCVCGIGEFATLNNWSITFQEPTAILPCTGPPTTNAHLVHQPCEDDVLRFAAADGLNYQWTGPNGFQSSEAAIALNDFSESLAGIYNCQITTTENCYDEHSIEVQDICQRENHSINHLDTKEFCVGELLAYGFVDESTNNNFLDIQSIGNCIYVTNFSPGIDSVFTREKIGSDEIYKRYIIEAMGVTGIEASFPIDWTLSPNPSSGQLLLKTPGIEITKITLLDVNGTVLKRIQPGHESTLLDLTNFPNSVYVMHVESRSGNYFERVVLMK